MLLALVVAVIAWQLTRWITHVNHSQRPVVSIIFDERPSVEFERLPLDATGLQRERYRFAEAALTSQAHVLFLITPTTRSIALGGVDLRTISCSALPDQRGESAAFLVDAESTAVLAPVPIQISRDRVFIPVPNRMREDLAQAPGRRGGIICQLAHPLATAPTFTERAVTVRARTSAGGAVVLDVSALEDVDDLRFSGGIQSLLGGDRTRILYGGDDIVSAEWVDVTAQEQRDIVLVLIGALSAIAASTVIEAVRPFVERRTKGT